VLPSGQQLPDPGEILALPSLGATVRDLTERFDVVLVDAPSLHATADATVLSKVTDSALLVVRAGRTLTADVERSTDLLERVGAQLAGAVLNALPRKLPTGSSWNRVGLMSQASDTMVTSMLGDTDTTGTDREDEDEPPIWAPPRPTDIVPARGRARVVNGVVTISGRDDDYEDDPVAERVADESPARGQARVVIITDAQPPANDDKPAPTPQSPAPAATPTPTPAPPVQQAPAPQPPAPAPHLPSQRDPSEQQSDE
jgi:hypothetical protein